MAFSAGIVGFGRAKGRLSAGVDHYLRLLGPYASVSVTMLKPVATRAGRDASIEAREHRMLSSKWPRGAYPVALAEEGRPMDSRAFAQWVELRAGAGARVAFIIGGAHGLPAATKKECAELISLSPLTFSHEIALLVLVEQLYRAFTILQGHPYHK
ncbi:MAG: 23S rRNA (pseudouridine(1915)-N(3))-methyltransferase RlmH [Chitinivibrionales bacterium]|nr:23S rRNA (pseudouridine(1915)-N(3))-methyltransferase RlmH [Chitinivibrionales bacterium]MBD3394514.1 23S rRNA (pseudouridine(1915)-N(3))-methyltransferase RlmH [Chitinivibrionales bacterium]